MRRRYAVFANGWGSEYLRDIGRGLRRFGREQDADFHVFVNHSAYGETKDENLGEVNIFLLPDIRLFDGVMLLTNSFNLREETEELHRRILEAGVPGVSLEAELEGLDHIGSDNYVGMYELTEHLIREKGVRNLLFIGGLKEHPECQIRLGAVRDAAQANGVLLPESQILFGDWSAKSAVQCLEGWFQEQEGLPDAILCANDVMAVAVCDQVTARGYRVPEDVLITGYDNTDSSWRHHPGITTISKGWEDIGYQAARRLACRAEGKPFTGEMKVCSHVIYRESSGDGDPSQPWKGDLGRDLERTDGFETDRHFRHLYKLLRKCRSPQELHKELSYFFQTEGWMEGKNFALCLHEGFFAVDDPRMDIRRSGYSDRVQVVCSLEEGKAQPMQELELQRAVLQLAGSRDKPGIYLYVGIHSDDKHYGFAMLGRDLEIARDNLLYIWTRHMSQCLQQVRSNRKIAELTSQLARLSQMDILTDTYNRTGCQKVIYPFLENCQKNGGQGIVMFADIDHMKQINDKFGHGAGDRALQLVAGVLKRELPPGFLVGRYGGDEFYIAGEKTQSLTVEDITAHIQECLEQEARDQDFPCAVTLSIGGVTLAAGETFDLNGSLQKADEFMYQMKKHHHQQVNLS